MQKPWGISACMKTCLSAHVVDGISPSGLCSWSCSARRCLSCIYLSLVASSVPSSRRLCKDSTCQYESQIYLRQRFTKTLATISHVKATLFTPSRRNNVASCMIIILVFSPVYVEANIWYMISSHTIIHQKLVDFKECYDTVLEVVSQRVYNHYWPHSEQSVFEDFTDTCLAERSVTRYSTLTPLECRTSKTLWDIVSD